MGITLSLSKSSWQVIKSLVGCTQQRKTHVIPSVPWHQFGPCWCYSQSGESSLARVSGWKGPHGHLTTPHFSGTESQTMECLQQMDTHCLQGQPILFLETPCFELWGHAAKAVILQPEVGNWEVTFLRLHIQGRPELKTESVSSTSESSGFYTTSRSLSQK